MTCAWCGGPLPSAHHARIYCSPAHKAAFGNWCASRGKTLFPIALAWRTMRGRKGVGAQAMAEMVRFLDQCAAELSGRGAPPIARHFARVRATGNGISTWSDFPRR